MHRRACCRERPNPTQRQNDNDDEGANRQQTKWMLEIAREQHHHDARNRQVREGHAFKRSTRGPRGCRLLSHCLFDSRETEVTIGWQRDFLSPSPRRQPWRGHLLAELPSSAVHAWLSVRWIFISTREKPGEIIVFRWCQCQMGQPERFTSAARSLPGFTTWGRPTAASMARSVRELA